MQLLEERDTKIRKRENGPSCEVLGHEPDQHGRRHLAPLDNAQVNEPGHNSSRMSQGHARQIGEGGQGQLFGRASERAQDPSLRVGDQRLERSAEVHSRSLPLIDERILTSMSGSTNGNGKHRVTSLRAVDEAGNGGCSFGLLARHRARWIGAPLPSVNTRPRLFSRRDPSSNRSASAAIFGGRTERRVVHAVELVPVSGPLHPTVSRRSAPTTATDGQPHGHAGAYATTRRAISTMRSA